MALICLLLCGGVNASAVEKWVAYDGSTQVSITITTSYADKFVSNLQAKAYSRITYSHSGITGSPENYVGVPVETTNKLYLKPTTSGYLNLRFNCAANSPATVTIHDNTDNKDVASLNVTVAARTNTDTHGDIVLFEVVANHEYEIIATGKYYILRVNKYESSDVASVSETMTASDMQTAIGSGKTVVKMQRTLKAGIWNTFCSPIQLGTSAVKVALKCDKVYVLDKYESNTITFKELKGDDGEPYIDAGIPCLIKPTKDVTEISVSNSSHPATYNSQTVTSGNLSFVAALAATNIYTSDHSKFYLNTSGNLVYPTSGEDNKGTIKGLRAYFQLASGGVKDLNIVFDDSEVTGIKTVERNIFDEGRVYSIDGRYMGDSTDNLSRGIYIQNGRKFVVK